MAKKTLAAGLAGMLAAPAVAAVPVATQIGVAAAVRGKVFAFPPAAQAQPQPVGREITSGKPLFLNERVTTDEKGRMQIMLIDETTFTLGPKASMVLDEFVYDPATGAGKVSAQVTKGAFRFVTGHIGHKDPSSVKVKFPTGTMGIRGTIVAGNVGEDGSTTVVLLGPGTDNNAGERPGAFALENGGGSVDVNQPGFGSTMGSESQAPTPPSLVPTEQMGAILGALAPADQGVSGEGGGSGSDSGSSGGQAASSSGESSGSGETAGAGGTDSSGGTAGTDATGEAAAGGDAGGGVTALAGQDTMAAAGDLADTTVVADATGETGAVTLTASADSGDQAVVDTYITNGAATWDGMRLFPGGSGFYAGSGEFLLTQCNGGACASPTGYFLYYLAIDFGGQTYGGGDSGAYVSASDADTGVSFADSLSVPQTSFAGMSGPAVVSQTADSGYFKAGFSLQSLASVGDAVDVDVDYDDGLNVGSGAASSGRTDSHGFTAADWTEVQAVPAGKGHYAGGGSFKLLQCGETACGAPTGFFHYLLEIDFDAKKVGGGESGGTVFASDPGAGVAVNDSLSIPLQNFGEGGPAVVPQTSVSTYFKLDFSLLNYLGTADAVGVLATYINGSIIGLGEAMSSLESFQQGVGGISDWGAVAAVPGGTGRYAGGGEFFLSQCNGGGCGSPAGFFNYLLEIDFGANTFGGPNSGAYVNASDQATGVTVSDSIAIGLAGFGGSGPATITRGSDSGFFTIDMSLKDVNGMAGMGLDAAAAYSDGLTMGSGSGSSTFELVQPLGADTTWGGVLAIPSGAGLYAGGGSFNLTTCNGVACESPSGLFGYLLKIDFGARTYGGEGSGAFVSASATGVSVYDDISIPETSYAGNSGIGGDPAVIPAASGFGFSIDFTLKDVGGVSAAGVDVAAHYLSGDGLIIGDGSSSAPMSPADGVSLWGTPGVDGVQGITTGAGVFSGSGDFHLTDCGGVACVNPAGSFSYVVNVDFANRTFGGNGSVATVSASDQEAGVSITDSMDIWSQPYAGASGVAAFRSGGWYFTSYSGNFGMDFTLKDVSGVSAMGLKADATYDNWGGAWAVRGNGSSDAAREDVSDWSAVQAIQGGTGWYGGQAPFFLDYCNDDYCGQPSAFFRYGLLVDFANKTYGGGGSGAYVYGGDPANGLIFSDSVEIPPTLFSDPGAFSGPARIHKASVSGFSVDFTLKDVKGVSALAAEVSASYDDGWTVGFGRSTADRVAPRVITDGAASWDDVRTIQAGTGQYAVAGAPFTLSSCEGVPCGDPVGPHGTFGFTLDVDFGARSYNLNSSMTASDANLVAAGGSVSGSIVNQAGTFGALAGNAVISAAAEMPYYTLEVTLKNAGGAAAAAADASASYTDTVAGTAGSGSVTDVPVVMGGL